MDYADIIKRAWDVTWRYKTLWILGLFAGATGSGYVTWGSGYRSTSRDFSRWTSVGAFQSEAVTFLHDWAPVLIAALVAIVLVGLLLLVLSFAAQAGLIRQVDSAEGGGRVSASEGWNAGFHDWWGLLVAGLVLLLPIVVFALVVFAAAAAVTLPLLVGFGSAGAGSAAGWTGVAVLVAIALLALPLYIVLAFVLGTMYVLAVRHLVLERRTPMEAVRASWVSFRTHLKDVLLMWLITVGLGLGIGVAVSLVVGAFSVSVGAVILLGLWPAAPFLGLIAAAISVVVMAAWNTFTSALWTVFFRKLTGREAVRFPRVAAYHGAVSPPVSYPAASSPTPPDVRS